MEFLNQVAKVGREIFKDIANKHEDGEFLPEVTDPNLHREKQEVLVSYCDCLVELGNVMREECKVRASDRFGVLVERLKENRSKEHSLFWKAFSLDIGGDH
jgi:hypothetical protein